MKRVIPLIAAVATLVPASGAGAGAVRVVKVEDIDFTPQTLAIRKGATVRWDFLDEGVSHNVISRGRRRFAGSPVKSRGSHRVAFRRSGIYRYVCTLHPGMDGRVVVR